MNRDSLQHALLIRGGDHLNMNNRVPEDNEDRTVVGFETPRSPDSSYNNVYPLTDDEKRDPPLVPQQLQHPLLGYSATRDLPPPLDVLLNHLYIENRTETPRSAVALGFTHRFRSKYVSVVLYKAVRSNRRPSS